MDSISERLALAEDELVAAAMEGGAALTKFYKHLETLLADVEQATSAGDIDDSTLDAWSESTLRLTQLNQSLLQLEELSSTIQAEVATAFAKVDLAHLAGPSSSKPQQKRRTDTRSLTAGEEKKNLDYRGTPYIETAYQWLLHNLHNPYPSKLTRDGIAQQTGASRELIDAWFISARQRIGWTALRKNRFHNKRADIVKAAALFFFPENHPETLDPLLEMEFASMDSMAKELYGGRFSDEGHAVTQLDRSSHKHRQKERKRKRHPPNPYPSPAQSSDETEVSSLQQRSHKTLESPEQIRPRGTRKRRISLSESECDRHLSSDGLRLTSPSPAYVAPSLLSPSPELATLPVERQNPEYLGRPLSPLRKRSLPAAQNQPPSKRARISSPSPTPCREVSPDAHVSTDTANLDNWFERNTTLPVNIPGIDLDVEVFNYSHSEAASSSPPLSSTGPITPDSSFVGSFLEDTSHDMSVPSHPDVATQSADYSHIFEGLEDSSIQSGQIGTIEPATAQWHSENFDLLTQMTTLSYSPLEANLHLTHTDLDPSLEPTTYDFSEWFANSQGLPSVDSVDLPSPLSSTLTSDFNHTQTSFSDFSQFFPPPSSSQEEKRRRLEEIRAEALRLEQELANPL